MTENNDLNANISRFYDDSSALWEKTWGEHMHHGYYGNDGQQKKDHRQAQIDLIDELIKWGELASAADILDVGCGIGGSSLYLAEKFNARVVGITLSKYQVERAKERASEKGLASCVHFQVADGLNPPFPDESFDVIWSLESLEHIPEKATFMENCYRLLKPGGKLIVATWCHRNTPPELSDDEQALLEKIYHAYHLPYIVSVDELARLAQAAEFADVKTADWTNAVAPFWQAVVKSVFRLESINGLLHAGWGTIRGAMAMSLMIRGYREGIIRFGLVQGTKR
jgi:tocopherol O-methyltransferase